MLKISLPFKKNTNCTGEQLENSHDQECEIFRLLFLHELNKWGDFQICICVPLKVSFRKCATYVLDCSFSKSSLTDWQFNDEIFNGRVMQNKKAPIRDRLCVSKVP